MPCNYRANDYICSANNIIMATIKFYYRSKKDNADLTLRFLHRIDKENDIDIFEKTQFRINKEVWIETRKKTIKDALLRNKAVDIKAELTKLENHILSALPKDESEINKLWLKGIIKDYYSPKIENKLNESVVYWLDYIIRNAHTIDNSKGGVGLSKSRINGYRILLKQIKEFSTHLLVKECDANLFDEFKDWFINLQYAPTTYSKRISDLKTVCRFARKKGVEVSYQLNDIKIKKASAYDEDMDVIFLNENDIKKLENLKLDNLALINSRKWLLLACFTGQRGNTLVNRVIKENFYPYGDKMIIRLKQKKGNKTVSIPVLPKVQEIYNKGLPYKMAVQKLNVYFKKLGQLAEINEMVVGTIRESIQISEDESIQRNVKKERPKWMYISSHIGRRSFCSNHYRKLPTPLIMRVSGHSKEETLLRYINQQDDDHLDAFFEHYDNKEEPKETINYKLNNN